VNLNRLIVKSVFNCLLILSSCSSFAQEALFLRDFNQGSTVEGSSRVGGLQPDYFLDTESKEFSAIWNYADQVGTNQKLTLVQKVELIVTKVRDVFSEHHSYNDPVYVELMKKYKESGQSIPLSKYVSCGAGVCRENALLLHFALKKAGIPNHFVYAKVLIDYGSSALTPEDHAFVVFEFENERWIADSYYKQFNGYSFDEFMQYFDILRRPLKRLPFAETYTEPRTIVRLNRYPQVVSCRSAVSQ
jgi:hypothetical protein